MPRRLPAIPLLLLLLTLLAACAGQQARPEAPAGEAGRAAALVRDSARALRQMRAQSPSQELDYWLEDAKAVVILPEMYQAGFLGSIMGGNGVVLAREADGGWSPPAFLKAGGAGFGYQIGLERARVVLVVLEREALDEILAGGLNFSTTAMYDMVGVREETGPDSRVRGKPVLAFADGAGIMAGVALRGGGLGQSRALNQAYYGAGVAEGEEILRGGRVPGLEVLELWEALRVALPAGPKPPLGRAAP